MSHATITPEVEAVLTRSTITGNLLVLPPGQLERKLYEAVNKALVNAGGKWDRFKKGHLFPSDPRAKLGLMLETGISEDQKQKFQAFYTPPDLAKQVVEMACIEEGNRVLEPSAGNGALASEVVRNMRGTRGTLLCVELDPEKVADLTRQGYSVHAGDFLAFNGNLGQFDRIVMNPPFTKGQDVKHILHALTFLRPGGRCVAICSAGPLAERKLRHLAFEWEPIPADTFKESGTSVATVLCTFTV